MDCVSLEMFSNIFLNIVTQKLHPSHWGVRNTGTTKLFIPQFESIYMYEVEEVIVKL